jgi:hypothetical protein
MKVFSLSTNVLSILSLVSLACFLALVILQTMELLFYGGQPSVWPM